MTRTSLLLAALLSFQFVSACASSTSEQGQAPATQNKEPEDLKSNKDSTANKASNPTSKSTVEGYACDGGAGLNFKQGDYDIDGNNLSMYTGRSKSKKTLCEILKSTGKKSAIFQFAGVTCISCMDESKKIADFISTSKGKDVAHILVFTDFFEDTTDEDFQGFISKYATDATVVYDESKLWKYYSEDPSLPSRATIMSMNLNAEGVIINQEGQFDKILDAAAKLANDL